MKDRRRNQRRRDYLQMVAFILVGTFAILGYRQATTASKRSLNAINAVQAERARVTLRSCLDNNDKHTALVKKINAKIPDGPQREFPISLVDNIAPYTKNCQALVKSRVKAKT